MNLTAGTTNSAEFAGYEYLARQLTEAGLDTLFGLMGEANLDLIACLVEKHAIRYVSARHEAAAVAMADGFSRATGKIGFATVTCGPGLTNAITAIVGAVRNHARVLLITGQLPPWQTERSQTINQSALLANTGAAVVNVATPEELSDAVRFAIDEIDRTCRPVVLNVAIPVFESIAVNGNPRKPIVPVRSVSKIDEGAIRQLATMFAESERAVILAGRGAVDGDAGAALRDLSDKTGASLATTLLAHGLFSGHERNLGLVGGLSTKENFEAFRQADLVVVFGAGLNGWTTRAGSAFPQANVVWVDRDVSAFQKGTVSADLVIVGDAAEIARTAANLCNVRTANQVEHNTKTHQPARNEVNFSTSVIDPGYLCQVIDKLAPDARTVTLDGGHFMEFPCQFLSIPDEKGFLFTLGFGAVGMGLATAIGAAVGRPDRLSICVVGDGGLMMSLQEIETAARCHVPILILVMNDGAYGAEMKHLADHGWNLSHASFKNPDFSEIARAMGASGIVMKSVSDLGNLAGAIANLDGPFLIDARVDPEVRAEWMSIMHAARENAPND